MTGQLDPREADEFYLRVPAKIDEPWSDLAWLREHRPILYHSELDQWFVFRYSDVADLFRDERLSANRMKGFVNAAPPEVRPELSRLAPYLEQWVMMIDGADHERLRNFLHVGFNPQAVRSLRPVIRSCANELLDATVPHGRLDACRDYAFLLPAYVLSDFLGVHPNDRQRVVDWSVDFVDFFNVVPITAENTHRMVRSAFQLMGYTRELLAERRRQPADDFLGAMVAAEADGLTEDEIVGNAMLLLLAGHVAVRNLIGNVLHLLLTHTTQWELLQADPALINAAVEETLRFESAVTMIPRVALEDIDIDGHTIRAGQIVQLSLASADRDPSAFDRPDDFDISRRPTRHAAFGFGPHTCLGARLAREEAHIAIEELLRRVPSPRLDPDRPTTWYRNAGNRGPENLPLVW